MPRVESSAVRRIDRDAVSSTLLVTFVDGDVYAYFDVPRRVYEAFLAAESKGRFFAADIRPRYRCRKLPPPHSEPAPATPRPTPRGLGPNPAGLLGAAVRPDPEPQHADALATSGVTPSPRRPLSRRRGGR